MNAHNATLRELSNLEVQNLELHQRNQELARQLLESAKDDDSWREALDDDDLKAQLEQLEADRKKSKSRWEVMKSVASAIVVGSGVNWAEDDELTALVIDESDD
jgi:lipid II:glycine glycyltransferase (peptidoglycan interpeptide bridge formation enzyme)